MVRASEGDSFVAEASVSSNLIKGTLAGPANENLDPSLMGGVKDPAATIISTASCMVLVLS